MSDNTVVTLNVAVDTQGAATGLANLRTMLAEFKSTLNELNSAGMKDLGARHATEELAKVRSEIRQLKGAMDTQTADYKASLEKQAADHKAAMDKITAQQAAATAKRAADELASAEKTKEKLLQQRRQVEIYRSTGSGDLGANLAALDAQKAAAAKMEAEIGQLAAAADDIAAGRNANAAAKRVATAQATKDAILKIEAEYASMGSVADDIRAGKTASAAAKRVAATNEVKAANAKMEAEINQLAAAAADIQAGRIAKALVLEKEAAAAKIALMRQVQAADLAAWEARGAAQAAALAKQLAAERLVAEARMKQNQALQTDPRVILGSVQSPTAYVPTKASVTSAFGDLVAAEEAAKKIPAHLSESAKHTALWADHTRDLHSAARGVASSFNAMWLTWGNIVPLLAGAALSSSLVQAVKKGAEFEYHMTFIKALGDESAAAVDKLSASVLNLSKSGLFGPLEVAAGLRILEQAGIRAANAMLVLPHALDLAVVGEMTMAQAGTTLVGVMNAFELSVYQASHVGDVFAKAAAESQTSVEQMTGAMRTASVAGAMYGATMEDTATALTLLAKLNITGTAAGTSFRNMLKELYAPTDAAAKVLRQMQVSASDASGSMRPFADVIYDLRGKLEQYDKISQTNILQKLFGERGAKEAVAMLSLTRAEWDKLNGTIRNSSGFISNVAAELEVTTKGSFKQAFNTLEVSLIKAFENSGDAAKNLALSLRTAFDSPEMVAGLTSIVTGAIKLSQAMIDVAPTVLRVVEALALLKLAQLGVLGVTAITAAMTGLSTALTVVAAESALAGGGLVGLRAGLAAASSGAAVAAGAVGAGGLATALAMLTNPLTWVIAAVGALAYAWYSFSVDTAPDAVKAGGNLVAALENQRKKLEEVNAELIRKANLEANPSGGKESNAVKAEIDRLQALKKTKEESLAGNSPVWKGGKLTGMSPTDYAKTVNEVALLGKNIAKATEEYGRLKGAESVHEEATRRANASEVSRQYLAQQNLKAGNKQFTTPSRDAERNLSAEAKGYLDLYAFKEKLAKDEYKTEVELAKSRLENGLMTQREFSVRRAEIEADYIAASEKAYEDMDKSVSEKAAAAERESTKTALKNARERILGEQIIQQQADANTERIALQKANDKSAGESKKYMDKTLPGMSAKLKAEQDALWAGRDNGLMNASDKAASEAAIAVTKTYATEIAAAETKLAIMYAQTGQCTEATAALEEQILATKAAMEAQSAQAAEAARKLVDYGNSATYGMKAGMASYLRDVENVAAKSEKAMVGAFKSMEDAIVKFVTTGKIDFKSLADSIVADMVRMTVQERITGPLAKSGMGFLDGLFGGGYSASNIGSTGMFTGPMPAANGNVFASADLHRYANTIVSSPTLFRFAQGGAFRGVMGEAGPEAIMPLTRGADGKLGVRASNADATTPPGDTYNVTVNVGPGTSSEVRRAAGQGAREAVAALTNARRYA